MDLLDRRLTYAVGVDSGTRRRLLALTLALVLVTPLSVVAARWQWTRHLERDARNAAVTAAMAADPVPWQRLLADGYSPTDEWRRVQVRGTWEPNGQLLVRKQVVNRAVGFSVMTPLRAEDGTRFHVIRGWVSAADGPIPTAPAGEVTVVLRLRPVTGEGPMHPGDLPAGQVNRIVPAELAGDGRALPIVPELVDPVPEGLVAMPWPELSDGPHVSYTFQWILIGLTGIVVYVRVFRSEWRLSKEAAMEPVADDA